MNAHTSGTLERPLDRWGFTEFLREGRRRGHIYDMPELDGVNDAIVSMDGRKVRNLAGIGALGWQYDPAVRQAFLDTATDFGLVVGGSRMVQGLSQPHLRLERLLAQATGTQAALTFATGMLANVGFAHAMSTRLVVEDDLVIDNTDMVFVLDHDSHWSMWKAVEKFVPGQNLRTFRHNDPASLRRILQRLHGRKIVVGFETVYSADGSVAPVGELLDLCEESGAISFVDDANGFLMYGNGQRRFAQEYADLRRADFLMLALGKTVGISGGALAGDKAAIDAFRMLSGTSMFTTNLQPPSAGAMCLVIERMLADPSIADDYLNRVDRLRAQLLEIGCTINQTPSYITSIRIGSDRTAAQVREDFLRLGFLVPVFRYPAVPRNKAVIRIMMNNRLSDEDLQSFVDAVAELKRRYGF
ncbi:aminotransferase class I/II-fold pyridoxal phosphate-dependent enzyme [Actinoplanes sp. TFC3]|uniref:aminotransferase class I/II-fold pyridoxal phosphate-dependent enzyme n=1 Tax=Actinoplanes sp. TFC3 TaxID=1710355 RepID=UPI0009EA70F0|nr:aminotransferase class I/II-fold pyridoxal phosphate-dependent enzyme [Actinoplanes sp. TFC3]